MLFFKSLSALLQFHPALHSEAEANLIRLAKQRMLSDRSQIFANGISRLSGEVPGIVSLDLCSLRDLISGISEACTRQFGTVFHDCLHINYSTLSHGLKLFGI